MNGQNHEDLPGENWRIKASIKNSGRLHLHQVGRLKRATTPSASPGQGRWKTAREVKAEITTRPQKVHLAKRRENSGAVDWGW